MNDYILTEYSPQYEHALAHHGVKGQKWGVRRYQPYSTTGKRKSGKGGSEIGLAARRASQAASNVGYSIGRKMRSAGNGLARKMQAYSEAAREKKERKRVLKEEKQKAKYSSSAGQALKNKSKFTTEELKQIKDRLQVEQSLADMKQKDFDRGVKYIKAIAQIATSSYEVGDILSQVVTGKKIAEYRKDKIAKDEAAKAAKEADKAAKDKGGGSSKSETSKTSEHSTTSKTTKDDKKKTKEAKGPKLINPIFDTKSNTGAPVSIFGESKTSDVVSAVDEALKGLRKADIAYRTEHARETPTLEWGVPGRKGYTTSARTLSEKLLDDISSLKIDGDGKTDYSKMDPTNNEYDDRKKKVKHGEVMRGRTIQVYVPDYNGYLAHHGIKGQKWGQRRYQNEDGTLTPAGKQRERSGRGTLNAGPVSVDPVKLAGGVARAVKNDIAGRAEANRRMARIDAATNRPVGREKNVTGSAYIGKGPSPSEKHQTQMQNQAGASIADYDYQHEHRYDDIPVQSLNGPFEEQPNYSIAAYDEEQKKKQKQMQTVSFGVLAKQLGKSLMDSAKFIASGYVQKIKSSLNKMLSEAASGIKKKVNENRSSRIRVTHNISYGPGRSGKMGHSEIKMGRTIEVYGPDYSDYLAHHGIKGQKWGVRRFQNPDGSLTEAGKKRQAKEDAWRTKKAAKLTSAYNRQTERAEQRYGKHVTKMSKKELKLINKQMDKKEFYDAAAEDARQFRGDGYDHIRQKVANNARKSYERSAVKRIKFEEKLAKDSAKHHREMAIAKELHDREMENLSHITPGEYNRKAVARFVGTAMLTGTFGMSGYHVSRNYGLLDRPTEVSRRERKEIILKNKYAG